MFNNRPDFMNDCLCLRVLKLIVTLKPLEPWNIVNLEVSIFQRYFESSESESVLHN